MFYASSNSSIPTCQTIVNVLNLFTKTSIQNLVTISIQNLATNDQSLVLEDCKYILTSHQYINNWQEY